MTVDTARQGMNRGRFLYLTEFDLSVDNGHTINEREFALTLRRLYPDDTVCLVPRPSNAAVPLRAEFDYADVPCTATRYPRFLAAALRRVGELRRTRQIEAVVCRLGSTPILPLAIQRGLRLPVLLKTLALYSRFAEDVSVRRSRTGRARLLALAGGVSLPAYRALLQRSPYSDTVGTVYARWLSEKFGLRESQLDVIPNGYNADHFEPGDVTRARRQWDVAKFSHVIGYVGALTAMRHLELIVRCFAAIAEEFNAGLMLVGEGPERPALERFARDRGIADRVVFTGTIPYARVPGCVQCFDVGVDLTLVSMRIDGVTVATSFSQKIPQYLGSGVPVVAWETGDTEFLRSNDIGELVPLARPAALTGVLRRLLARSTDSCSDLRARAAAYARRELALDVLVERRVARWTEALATSRRYPASGSATDNRARTAVPTAGIQ